MQAIQNFHLKKQFDDIGDHYGIDCNGKIYEGKNIRYKGSHALFFNTGIATWISQDGPDFVGVINKALNLD